MTTCMKTNEETQLVEGPRPETLRCPVYNSVLNADTLEPEDEGN